MRWAPSILVTALCLAGCAAKSPPVPLAQLAGDAPAHRAGQSHPYDDAIAASLVFAPPIAGSEPPMRFSRDGRQPEAYAGFEEITTTYYYLRVDDRQLDYNGASHDRFERRAISTRLGVTYR